MRTNNLTTLTDQHQTINGRYLCEICIGKEAAHFGDRNREWVFSGWNFSFWFLLGYTLIQKNLTEDLTEDFIYAIIILKNSVNEISVKSF